ncbi:hypothetical protein [Methyloferula stellata]|uniref:hypothetical protein n=1 Tax=Methyloferula stellata TaxID=876270 RepID=UPI00037ED0EB|nr:hypothetical protein [Methyloferula stellata]
MMETMRVPTMRLTATMVDQKITKIFNTLDHFIARRRIDFARDDFAGGGHGTKSELRHLRL